MKSDNEFFNLINDKDFLILNFPPADKELDKDNFFYQVDFFELLQKLEVPHLFFKVDVNTLIRLLYADVESPYEVKAIIPWVKESFNEVSLCKATSIYKKSLEYLVVLDFSHSTNLKKVLSTIFIETEPSNKVPVWERKLFTDLLELGLQGYIINENALMTKDNFSTFMNDCSKVNLF